MDVNTDPAIVESIHLDMALGGNTDLDITMTSGDSAGLSDE